MKQKQTVRRAAPTPKGQPGGDSPRSFPDEAAHLAAIHTKLDAALESARQSLHRLDREYNDAKRYMAQNRGEIDPHEMFQNELSLKQIDSSGALAAERLDRMSKLQDSPYFARIDFQQQGSGAPVPYYIGRFAFTHENELLIVDWRALVAGMFYDFEIGPAGYVSPRGRVEGTLSGKRQFKIRGGMLEYVLESSVNIQDDVLQRELSHTSDEKMKSIIATIQREQNEIIRNERADTILIQGVAGSGKTSIALHRVAFLLYRQRDRLAAQNIAIISPNRVFGDYISGVLPELGEEPIFEVGMADIAQVQLEGVIGFEGDRDPMAAGDGEWARRVSYKSTLDFVRQMDRYIERMPHRVFEAADYADGPFTAPAGWIQARFAAYGKYPVKKRLQMVADDIRDRFETGNIMGDDPPKPSTILRALKAMLKIKNTLALYKDFYRELGEPGLLKMPGRKLLEWNDVFPFLYLHTAFEGARESPVIRHLVVDEMQDYTPIQFALLNRLFPCPKTILGDFGQRVNPNHLHSLEDIRQLYKDSAFVALNTSYRSTCEIMNFARGIQDIKELKAIQRHGDSPEIIGFGSRDDEYGWLRKAAVAFRQSKYSSLGIIAKTNEDARALYTALGLEEGAHLITPDSEGFSGGVSVVSVGMSKGLEFDEVIVADASRENYRTEHDRRLLYVACTRAMHRLTLLHCGASSMFLP